MTTTYQNAKAPATEIKAACFCSLPQDPSRSVKATLRALRVLDGLPPRRCASINRPRHRGRADDWRRHIMYSKILLVLSWLMVYPVI